MILIKKIRQDLKHRIMQTNTTEQEILLMTNTSFAQRQLCEKEDESKNLTPQEQLKEACANGVMQELLPEIFEAPGNKRLYLWQMKPGGSFIQLKVGEFPLTQKKEFSIDPHNFLPATWYN